VGSFVETIILRFSFRLLGPDKGSVRLVYVGVVGARCRFVRMETVCLCYCNRESVVYICSFLLGFGDSCYNMQVSHLLLFLFKRL